MAASRAAAVRSTTRSPCWGPTSCRPIGRPSLLMATGTRGGGGAGHVEGIGELDPVGGVLAVDRARHLAGERRQGRAGRRDQDAAAAEQLDQPQVHEVEAVEDLEQLLGRRRLRGVDEVAQHRMDLVPARMTHEGPQGAQGGRPRQGEEITDGVVIEDGVQHDDLGAQRLEHPDGALAGGGHLGVDGGVAEGGGVGDPDRDVGVVEGGQPVGLGAGEGAQVGGVGADGDVEGAGDVGDAAGHGAVGREVDPAGRVGAAGRDAAEARLHAREAAAGARDPDGAAAVGPGGERHHPGRQRGRRAAGRSARPPAMCRTGSARGRRWRWSCCPSSRTRACWSCRRRRSRRPASGPRRGRRRWRAGRRRAGPSRRWCV